MIGVPDQRGASARWPAWCPRTGRRARRRALREFLADRVAKWWIPERVEFIDEVPKTSVGKFSKKTLRERFAEGCYYSRSRRGVEQSGSSSGS